MDEAGFEFIDKAHANLKCSICTTAEMKKQGYKIQCSHGRCQAAFHASLVALVRQRVRRLRAQLVREAAAALAAVRWSKQMGAAFEASPAVVAEGFVPIDLSSVGPRPHYE